MRLRPRIFIFAACALIAGLVATVVTAVLCSGGNPGVRTNVEVVGEGEACCYIIYQEGIGLSKAVMAFYPNKAKVLEAAGYLRSSVRNSGMLKYDETISVPSWCMAMASDVGPRLKPTLFTHIAGTAYCTGWPMYCLYGGSFALDGTTPKGPPTNIGLYEYRTHLIPMRPLALPLILNTLFFTLVLGGLYQLIAWMIRASRAGRKRRRGLCLACGYDRRGLAAGSICPECGAAAGIPLSAPPTSS